MTGDWLVPFKGRQSSEVWDQNFVWKQESVYIMDNHRAALWCWLQHMEEGRKYNLFHMDRHYDTLNASIGKSPSQSADLRKINIDEYLAIDENIARDTCPLIRWDNYFSLFLELYSESVAQCIFATHEDGDKPNCENWNKAPLWQIPCELEFWLSRGEGNWIFNLDLDFFFCDCEGSYIRMFSDEYAQAVFEIVRKKYQDGNIRVLTIALSPEFCGGRASAERLCEHFCRVMNMPFELPQTEN